MGIFDFLKKKKEDDLGDLGADLGPEPAFPGGPAPAGTDLFGEQPAPPPPGFTPSPTSLQMAQPSAPMASGNIDLISSRIEVISSKIDSLKASIDRLNEKLDYIERFLAASGGRRYG